MKKKIKEECRARVIEDLKEKFGNEPKVYDVVISDGARKLE